MLETLSSCLSALTKVEFAGSKATMRPLLILLFAVTVSGQQFVVSGADQETQNMDSGVLQLQMAISQQLSIYQKKFDARFDSLERMCEGGQTPLVQLGETEQVRDLVAKFVDKLLRHSEKVTEEVREKLMETLNETLADFETKMQPLREEISSVKSQISKLVTQDEVAGLQTKLTTLGAEATTSIKEEIDNLPTKDDLRIHTEQVGQQLQEVATALGDQSTCGDPTRVQEVLEKLAKSDSDLDELAGYLRDSSEGAHCESTFDRIVEHLETLTEAMTLNAQSMSDLEDSVKEMQGDFVTQLEDLETIAQKVAEGTQAGVPQPPVSGVTPSTGAAAGGVGGGRPACLDSNFMGGGRSLDICNAAVRFRKCHLVFVAFHCCRSCMNAGLIDAPPTRYSAPRNVPVLQALKSFRPS